MIVQNAFACGAWTLLLTKTAYLKFSCISSTHAYAVCLPDYVLVINNVDANADAAARRRRRKQIAYFSATAAAVHTIKSFLLHNPYT